MFGRHSHHPETDSMAGLFRTAARLMARIHHHGGHDHHAHHAQHRVLGIIAEKGPMPQSELLEILDVRSSSLSELLSKLEDRGLVSRERNEADRRGFIVAATDLARARMADREEVRTDADALFACLDETEREQLGTILGKLVAALKEDPRGHGQDGPRGFGGRGGKGRGEGRGKGKGRDRRGRDFEE